MKLVYVSILFLIAYSCSSNKPAEQLSFDSDHDVVSHLQEMAMNSDLPYEIVKSLTVEVGPRLIGTPQDKAAVEWAMNKFKQLGFDKVYKEPVEISVWSRGTGAANIIAPYPQKLVVTALGGSIGTGPKGITRELVKFESLEKLKEVSDGALKGKIVFINQTTERHKTGRGYGKAVGSRFYGASVAASKGAHALIIRSVGTDSDRFAHTGSMKYDSAFPKIPAAAVSNPDADMIVAMMEMEKTIKLNLTLTPRHLGKGTTYNVIGEIIGTERPKEIVLIGAHLDSWDEGTGAIDDGAGVGIVMSAASLIKALPAKYHPKRTIRVVLFGAEEAGLVGAEAYLAKHKDELHDHIVAAESDFGSREIWKFSTKINESRLKDLSHLKGALKGLGIEFGDNQATGGPDVSIFPKQGIPVVSLNQDGTDYFDYHHTPNDTLDKVSKSGLRQSSAAYATFAYYFAQMSGHFR